MADYRFSAQVISRSKGQSSVASAAYRAASRLHDERTGETHNYDRKGGVVHSEVLTPQGTPEWMADRSQLWNAVEAVERRKDAQLAREVQLSLPHELDQESRKRLVLDFVQEQFVNRGMIADVAIHAPSDKGDDRNHHAHIMLTMRELTGEGFGNKNRDWNNPEMLEQWRQEWAHHQNRALEREGHAERVSHLSYEAQGIDREPSQHLGPVASDMERNGKPSRIGDENRVIANDNTSRLIDHIELAKLNTDRAQEMVDNIYLDEIKHAQQLADLDLSQKHLRQKLKLEDELEKTYGTAKATIKAEVSAIDRRLEEKGVRKILRSIFGQARSDKETRRQMVATLTGIEKRENEQRGALERRQMVERQKEARRQNKHREGSKARQSAKERAAVQRLLEKGTQRTGRPDRQKTAKPATKPRQKQDKAPVPSPDAIKTTFKGRALPEVKSFNEPTLADKTRAPSHKLDTIRGEAKRPWERSSLGNDNKRPWEGRPLGRGRKPTPDGGKDG